MAMGERLLRRATCLVTRCSGGARLIHPIRRHYVRRYAGRSDRWILLDDFDGDLKFRVDRAAYMGSSIYWCGYHSVNELRCLGRLLRPSMVFADIGANHGEFTAFAAKRLPAGKVLAFEPLEDNYRYLTEHVQLNGFSNVLTYHCGLSDRSGEVALYTSEATGFQGSWNEGLASMYRSDFRASSLGSVRVEVFDDVFEQTGLNRLDGMKIDVEGAELPVLRGALRSIRQYRPFILLEINEETFLAAGYTTRDVVALLQSLDYRLFRIKPYGRRVPIAGDQLPQFCNTVWLPCTSS